MGFLTAFSRVLLDMTVSAPSFSFLLFFTLFLNLIVISSLRSIGSSLPFLLVPLDRGCMESFNTSVSNNSTAKKGSAIVLFDLCALVSVLHILCSCLAREQKSSHT